MNTMLVAHDEVGVTDALPLNEATAVADVFCGSLVRMERIGPCVRLTFAVPATVACAGHEAAENSVVAKIVLPAEAVADMARRLLLPDAASTPAPGIRRPFN